MSDSATTPAAANGDAPGSGAPLDDELIHRLRTEGLNYAQIMERLGCSKGGVSKSITRWRKQHPDAPGGTEQPLADDTEQPLADDTTDEDDVRTAAEAQGFRLIRCGQRDGHPTFNLRKGGKAKHVALTLDEAQEVLSPAESSTTGTVGTEPPGGVTEATPSMGTELEPVVEGEIVGDGDLTADRARELTDCICAALEGTWELIAQAYKQRAWIALDYPSWDAYCDSEFGTRLRLPPELRTEIVRSLGQAGLSIRAIESATGLGYGTVQRELSGDPNGSRDVQTSGLDGKTYKPTGPKAAPPLEQPCLNGGSPPDPSAAQIDLELRPNTAETPPEERGQVADEAEWTDKQRERMCAAWKQGLQNASRDMDKAVDRLVATVHEAHPPGSVDGDAKTQARFAANVARWVETLGNLNPDGGVVVVS